DLQAPLSAWVERCCDNSYENLGAGDSYVMYGPNWARAGTVPFRGQKQSAWEGGIRVPAFARLPGVVPAGARNGELATVMDVLPTLVEIARGELPDGAYRDRPVAPLQGASLLPRLTGDEDGVRPPDHYVGWELFGHRAVRQGDWKIVWD